MLILLTTLTTLAMATEPGTELELGWGVDARVRNDQRVAAILTLTADPAAGNPDGRLKKQQ